MRNAMISTMDGAISLLRATYFANVKVLLEQLLPRIEAGEFTDLGDCFTFVDINHPRLELLRSQKSKSETFAAFMKKARREGWDEIEIDPGINLLQWAVGELPICKAERTARAVACASR